MWLISFISILIGSARCPSGYSWSSSRMGKTMLWHRSCRYQRVSFTTWKCSIPFITRSSPSDYLGLGAQVIPSLSPRGWVSTCREPHHDFAARNVQRTGWSTAQIRNFMLANMADEEVYAINVEGRSSSLDVLYDLERRNKPVLLISSPVSGAWEAFEKSWFLFLTQTPF